MGEERVRRAVARLVIELPFYGALALRLEHCVLSPEKAGVPTAATDGKRIIYNASFLRLLSDRALIFLVAHETLHAALCHPLRGADKEDADAWNLAADDTVNRLLKRDWGKLPPFAVTLNPKRFKMTVSQWEKLSTEAKYALICRRKTGQGKGQGERVCQGQCTLPFAKDAPTPEQWRQWIQEAADFAGQILGHGTVPAWVDEWVTPVERAKVSWRKVLWQFIQSRVISHWNYPPSRRYQSVALLPKPYRERWGVLGIAIDTSGSISKGQLRRFWREVLTIRETYPRLAVRLVTCDAEVTKDELYPPGVPLPVELTLTGRGGTDFRPALECFCHPPVPEVVVYLTDGMGTYPEAAPPYPVLWVLSHPSPIQKCPLPFGIAIIMESEDVEWGD